MPWSDESDVAAAVASARGAFDGGPWRHNAPADRADALDRIAAEIESRAEVLARLVSQEIGQPISVSR